MNKKLIFKIEDKIFSFNKEVINSITFNVKSSPKDYSVIWNEQEPILKTINKYFKKNKNKYLFIDENIFNLYFKNSDLKNVNIFKAKATEKFKTPLGVLKLIKFLASKGFTKGDKLIVIGGGIIQDVAAFVCACYKRGIDWYFFPTTSLAISDSCIGGKTGINYNHAKNQLGLFYSPSEIILKPQFLKTLDNNDLVSGFGEIIKLHIIGGEYFVEEYIKNYKKALNLDGFALKKLILNSLQIKRTVIEEDQFDHNYRNSMNYGHTIGHAIEVMSNHKISHGHAIIIGMIIVNDMSCNRNLLKKEKNKSLTKILNKLLDHNVRKVLKKLDVNKLGQLLKKDKKTRGDITNFVFIKDLGNTIFVPIKINKNLLIEIKNIIKIISDN